MHLLCALLLIACAASARAAIQIREMPYRSADDTRMVGYFAYDDSKPGIRSGVIMIHEWWGLNDYARRYARDFAELGYNVLAIDAYGEGEHAEYPQDTMTFIRAATRDADAAKARFLVDLKLLKRQLQTDPNQVAAIGYCFGGRIVLDMARQGLPLTDVASLHGVLGTATPASKDSIKAKVLVERGSVGSLVPAKDLDTLEQELSAAGADYRVVIQDGAEHSFANPDTDMHRDHGLGIGYDCQADQRSQADLQAFLKDIFGQG